MRRPSHLLLPSLRAAKWRHCGQADRRICSCHLYAQRSGGIVSGSAVTTVVSQGCQLQQPLQLSQFSSSIELKGWRKSEEPSLRSVEWKQHKKAVQNPPQKEPSLQLAKVLRFFTVPRNQSAPPPPAARAAHELHANCLSERSMREDRDTACCPRDTACCPRLSRAAYRASVVAVNFFRGNGGLVARKPVIV